MKNPVYLILLLALGLVVTSYKWIESTAKHAADTQEVQRSTIDDIMTRTSVRTYSDRQVDPALVDTLLRAAMAAPTAANKQPWQFVVITEREKLDYISENFQNMKMAKEAQLAIVACGDLKVTLDGEARDFWVQDVSAATENLLLAAHALGLGAVWCGIYPVKERVAQFTELLELPGEIVPMACICIGYPSASTTPKDKWDAEKVHYNTWKGKSE